VQILLRGNVCDLCNLPSRRLQCALLVAEMGNNECGEASWIVASLKTKETWGMIAALY
jgi:hypothetical protein